MTSEVLTFRSRRLAKYSLMGGVSGRALQVCALLLIARVLDAPQFAIYAAAYTTIMASAGLSSSAISLGMNRFFSRRHRNRGDLRVLTYILLVVAVATSLLATFFSSKLLSVITSGQAQVDSRYFAAAGLVVAGDGMLAVVAGNHSPKLLAALELTRGAGIAIGGTLGALTAGVVGALGAFAVSETVIVVLAVLAMRRRLETGRPVGLQPTLREVFSVSGPGLVAGIIVQSSLWFAQIWTLRIGSLSGYAVLAMALRLGNTVAMIPGMLTRNFLAHLTSAWATLPPAEWRAHRDNYLKQNLALSLACFALLVPVSFTIRRLLGDEYDALPLAMTVLGAGFIATSTAGSLGVVLVAMKRTAVWALSDLVLALVLVACVTGLSISSPAMLYAAAFGMAGVTVLALRSVAVFRSTSREEL